MRARRTLVFLLLTACGATPPPPWSAAPPLGEVTCAPLGACAHDTAFRVSWPAGSVRPIDARVLVDGAARDAGDAELGDCIAPGSHVVRVESTLIDETHRVTTRAGEVAIEAAPGAVAHVTLAPAPDDTSFAFDVVREPTPARGMCAQWTPGVATTPVSIALRPLETGSVVLRGVRIALDDVVVLDTDDGRESTAGPIVRDGLTTPGPHELRVAATFSGREYFAFEYPYHYVVRRAETLTIGAAGARIRVRAGHRGPPTQDVIEGLYVEITMTEAGE